MSPVSEQSPPRTRKPDVLRSLRSERSERSVWPSPVAPSWSARAMYRLHRMLKPNAFYYRLAAFLEKHPRLCRLFTRTEAVVKAHAFGCRMCGQCALPATGYACPMTCPKQLRNGPCGGVSDTGDCEVYPGTRCVWLIAFERAEREGRDDDLRMLQRPVDHREQGRSSWVNYWQGRDEHLWVRSGETGAPELVSKP
jgi:hypothetical protein